MNLDKYKNNMPHPKYPVRPKMPRQPEGSHALRLDRITQYTKELEKYTEQLIVFGDENEKYNAELKVYNEHDMKLLDQFWVDAFEDIGIPMTHPKASVLKSISWQKGHAGGLSDVWTNFVDLSEFLT